MITIDLETEAIVGNPTVNPPKPIGAGIKYGDQPTMYLTGAEMERELQLIWNSKHELVFQNAPFDLRVIEEHLGLPYPKWDRVHDTKFLIYLHDPHATSMSLKPSAERILDWPVEERDELREWILANVKGATKKTWGAHICEGPYALVSKYCKADCDMTWALFQHLIDKVPIQAYNLERELQPYLTRAAQRGIRVDRTQLEIDYNCAVKTQEEVDARIQKYLDQDFDVHNGNQLADALDKKGLIKEWKLTPTGKRSTARPALMEGLSDSPELLCLLSYSGALKTCTSTFMGPWLGLSEATGRLHPSWNQTRGDDDYGTRTGRLSCSRPNLQNVPNEFDFDIPPGFPPIPNMRDYLLPEEGQIWSSRDFSAQEMRLLAHFENGDLCRAFQETPDLDPHAMVQHLILKKTGLEVSRKRCKNIGFGIMYGMGATGLSKQMRCTPEEAQQLMAAYHTALPGVAALQSGTQERGKYKDRVRYYNSCKSMLAAARKKFCPQAQIDGYSDRVKKAAAMIPQSDGITTAWGRKYVVEKPKIIDGKMRTFEYKLLNYLIQGSASDQTKRALLEWFRTKPEDQTFLATVHDEINISVPEGDDDSALKAAMERSDGLDVPMRTTLETGPTWGAAR